MKRRECKFFREVKNKVHLLLKLRSKNIGETADKIQN